MARSRCGAGDVASHVADRAGQRRSGSLVAIFVVVVVRDVEAVRLGDARERVHVVAIAAGVRLGLRDEFRVPVRPSNQRLVSDKNSRTSGFNE